MGGDQTKDGEPVRGGSERFARCGGTLPGGLRARGAGVRLGGRALAGSVLLLMGALSVLPGCGAKGSHGKTPKLYIELDKAFQPLRRDFEANSDKVRLVAIVTPMCGECIGSMQDVNVRLLSRIKSKDFVVFAVWTSVVPPDVAPRAAQAAEMFTDPRIIHYWEDSGRIARAFGAQAGLDPGQSAYDTFYLYGRNDTWDPQGTMVNEPPNQNALIAGWMPTPPRYRMGDHPTIKEPRFDVNALTKEVETLLAEPENPQNPPGAGAGGTGNGGGTSNGSTGSGS